MVWKRLFGGKKEAEGGGRKVAMRHGDSVIHYTLREGAEPTPDEDHPAGWQPVNALEEQMARMLEDPDAGIEFMRMFVKSDVLLATPQESGKPSERSLEEDEQVQILSFTVRGESDPGIFTSEARLVQAAGEGASYIQMSGRAALEMLAQTGAIVNPGPGLWARYDPERIANILSEFD